MSDEAMALALLLSTLERIAVGVERIADELEAQTKFDFPSESAYEFLKIMYKGMKASEASNAPDPDAA